MRFRVRVEGLELQVEGSEIQDTSQALQQSRVVDQRMVQVLWGRSGSGFLGFKTLFQPPGQKEAAVTSCFKVPSVVLLAQRPYNI